MDLKSLQKLKSKTSIKKKNLIHKIYPKIKNNNLDLLIPTKPKLLFLQAVETGFIFDNQIIAFFKFIVKHKYFKKKLYVRVYPFLPLTKKPAEVRMGKGKGKIDSYCKPVYPGSVIAEIRVSKKLPKKSPFLVSCKKLLLESAKRFSIKTKVVTREFSR